VKALAGCASEVDLGGHERKLKSNLGHVKKPAGNVTFDRMKPRDNRMYYISEATNLRTHDQDLKNLNLSSYAYFDQ